MRLTEGMKGWLDGEPPEMELIFGGRVLRGSFLYGMRFGLFWLCGLLYREIKLFMFLEITDSYITSDSLVVTVMRRLKIVE